LDLINRRGTPDLILATGGVMDGAGASSRRGAMGGARRRSLSHATVRHQGQGFFLQHRGETGIPFCVLQAAAGGVESGRRQPPPQALGRRLGVALMVLRLDQGHGSLPLDVLFLPPLMNQLGRRRILAHERI
jgi:hypothetical protein